MRKLRPLIAGAFLFCCTTSGISQSIVDWDFENNATLLQASFVDNSIFPTPTITWGSGPVQEGQSSPGGCTGFGVRTSGYTTAFSANHYLQFTLVPAPNAAINIISFTVNMRGNGTRPTNWALYTSEDSYASPVASGAGISGNSCTNIVMPCNLQTTDAVSIRIYFWGAGNGAGNLDIMDISANGYGNLLPVKLLSFDAMRMGSGNKLVWQVGQETNFKQYVVERSGDGVRYQTIGTVDATGAKSYSFVDNRPAGRNFYRLNMIDRSGVSARGKVVTVVNATNQIAAQLLPNVVSSMANLSLSVNEPGDVNITVSDMTGRRVMTTKAKLQSASQAVPLNLSTLQAGTYQMTVETAGGERQTLRFVKQ